GPALWLLLRPRNRDRPHQPHPRPRPQAPHADRRQRRRHLVVHPHRGRRAGDGGRGLPRRARHLQHRGRRAGAGRDLAPVPGLRHRREAAEASARLARAAPDRRGRRVHDDRDSRRLQREGQARARLGTDLPELAGRIHGGARVSSRDAATLPAAAALLALAAGAWLLMLFGPDTMMAPPAIFLGAWTVMMAAMMLPSAVPFFLLYRRGASGVRTGALAAGYLAVWAVAGVPALLAWRVPASVAGPLSLAAAGLYQLTPL